MSHVHDALRRATQHSTPGLSLETNQIISVVLKRKRTFAAITFTFFLVCCVIVLRLPKEYEAEMKLLVKNERQDLIISPERNTGSNRPVELTETEINSEIELLRSNDVLRKVVETSGLNHPEPGTVQASGEPSPVTLDDALIKLQRRLATSVVKKSNIIDVTYTSRSPQLACTVLKTLADDYLQAHLQVHGTPGGYAFFEQQATAFRDRLTQSENELKNFNQRYSSLVQPDQDQELTSHSMDSQASLEEVDAQIADYKHRIAQSQQLLHSLDPRIVTQMRTVPQSQLIANLNQTLVDLQNKRTDLVTKFRPDDRMVLEVDKQIADTKAALASALQDVSTEKETDANPVRLAAEKDLLTSQVALSGLEARRLTLAGVAGSYKTQMLDLAGATIQHDQLVRQVKENEDSYLLYEKKREEARIAESLDQQRITNVAVVEAPTVPVHPSGPKVKLDLLLAAICSAFLAFVIVVSLEYFAPKTQTSERPRMVAAVG